MAVSTATLPRRRPAGIRFDSAPATLDGFAASHAGPCVRPLGVAFPTTETQVDQLVRWANDQNVPLVPVSSARGPRSRGGTRPTVPSLVVDLSAMQRVIHADGRDRIAVIEPGVTFDAFDEALRPHGLRAFRPLLPRQGKSVLAAYLEREPTTVPNEHWDTTDPLASLSFTFGNGEHFRTGSGAVPGTLEENLRRGNRQMNASGPLVTDYSRVLLGSQGTLGIVSWASIYCEAIPAREEAHLFGADDFAAVAELARLLLLRQLGAQCFVLDRTQLAAVLASDHQAFERRVAADTGPRWRLYVNLTSPDYLPDQRMHWQRRELTGLAEQSGAQPLNNRTNETARVLAARLQQSPQGPYQNTPRGQHREVFCLTQLDKVPALLAQIEPLLRNLQARDDVMHGVYVQPTVQGVSCHLSITLFHAPQASAAVARTEQQLVNTLVDGGGFFSRPYGAWAEAAYRQDPAIVPFLRQVKQMFDPKGVLNPGRLCF